MKLEHIGMLEIEDKWAFPHRRGKLASDIKSGFEVAIEITYQIPDVVPDVTRMSIKTAIELAESPELPHHFNFRQAVDAIARGLKSASLVKPSDRARELLLIYEPKPELTLLPSIQPDITPTGPEIFSGRQLNTPKSLLAV